MLIQGDKSELAHIKEGSHHTVLKLHLQQLEASSFY